MGVAPTGMEYQSSSIVIHRIERGKIVEEWSEGTKDVYSPNELVCEPCHKFFGKYAREEGPQTYFREPD